MKEDMDASHTKDGKDISVLELANEDVEQLLETTGSICRSSRNSGDSSTEVK